MMGGDTPAGGSAASPPVDDLSAFVIAGRVRATPDPRSETTGRTPRQGIDDGVAAERIGFRRVFLSERWHLKEAGALLGAIGARTDRIDLATGVIPPAARHPLHAAGLGSTMQAAFGPRFVLGLGRGDNHAMGKSGMRAATFEALEDYVDIVRRLWRGETVSYDGPAGSYPQLVLPDRHEGPDPEIWFGSFGRSKAARTMAKSMDGVLLVPNMTPEATQAAVARIHRECERIDRDPASIRIAQSVVTAPELDELETVEICHARALTYLQTPTWGEALCEMNGWSLKLLEDIRSHEQLSGHETIADNLFHRSELVEPARRIPDDWMRDSCAIGSVDECVAKVREFREAGADEVVTYGSTPSQNAGLVNAWKANVTAQTS